MEGLRAKAATCRVVEKLQLSLTQPGENGSFLQDPFWTPRQVRWVGAWGPGHTGAAEVSLARGSALRLPVRWVPGLGCGRPCAQATRTVPAPTCWRYPKRPVAKGGEKANVEVPGKPRRYWNRARGSWKRSSAFSPSGPRCGRIPRLLLCCSGVQVPQNL